MNTVAQAQAADAVALLDRFRQSESVWHERAEDGRRLADDLRTSGSPVTVLHGPPKSGRTEFVRRWVIPALEDADVRTRYMSGAGAPAGDSSDSVDFLVWDDFGTALDEGPGEAGAAAVQALSQLVAAGRTRVGLVIDENHLSRLFALSTVVPQVLADIRELPRAECRQLLDTLPALTLQYGVEVSPQALEAIQRDLHAVRAGAPMDPEMGGIVAFEVCRFNPANALFTVEHYRAVGGLTGLLEAHLDFLLQSAPAGGDIAIGWAVLEQVAKGDRNEAGGFDDIAARFDAPADAPGRAVAWLEHDRHVIRRRSTGLLTFVHIEFLAAVEARLQRETLAYGWLRWSLRQGARQFEESEALLTEPSFRRAHAHRSVVSVAPDEAALMLRCALMYEHSGMPGAVDHWLRRVKSDDARVDILLAVLFNPQADVRRRAAGTLKGFPRPEVRTQLHLLALRDPDAGVRHEAVDSLRHFKDEALRSALIEELQHRTGPFRVQAIEALRMFDDPVAVAALAGVVCGNVAGRERTERRAALTTLALLDTDEAADALVGVALEDPDAEDREDAALALAALSREPTVEHVLQRLATYKPPSGTPFNPGLAGAGRTLGWLIVVLAVVACTMVAPGLIFATRQRWRVAAGLTLAPWLALGLAGIDTGASVWSLSVTLGLLLPLRSLLAERAGGSIGRYATALTAVLFTFCALTYFAVVHGLASLLAQSYRRGLSLIGCQATGVVMLVVAGHLLDEFEAFSQVSLAVELSTMTLLFASLIVLACTYAAGIATVVRDVFVRGATRPLRQRLAAVYDHVVQNPAAAAVLLRQLTTDRLGLQSPAAAVIRRHGRLMQSQLQAAWPAADARVRRLLFALTASRRDPAGIEMLRTMAPALGWRARLQYARADWGFRFSLWPRPALIMLALFLLTAGALGTALHAKDRHQPTTIAQGFDTDPVSWARGWRVQVLERLASQTVDPVTARAAGIQLSDALSGTAAARDIKLRNELIEAIGRVAPTLSVRPAADFVDTLAVQLSSPESQSSTIDALKAVGTPKAAATLLEFIQRPGITTTRGARIGQQADGSEARARAIAALGHMQHAGFEPLLALEALKANEALDDEVRSAAARALKEADPLMWAEYHVSSAYAGSPVYETAMAQARNVLGGDREPLRLLRARQVLWDAAVKAARGQLEADAPNYWAAKSALLEAVAVTDRLDQSEEVRRLGVLVTVGLHDTLGPTTPEGYAAAYDVLSRLEDLRGQSELSALVEANLVEASLTSGRHAEALRRAREVLRFERDRGSRLVMGAFELAALELTGDRAGADAAYGDLTRKFEGWNPDDRTNWTFDGTRTYISRARLDPQREKRLTDLLDRLESLPSQ